MLLVVTVVASDNVCLKAGQTAEHKAKQPAVACVILRTVTMGVR